MVLGPIEYVCLSIYIPVAVVLLVISQNNSFYKTFKFGVFWPLVVIKWSLKTLFELLFTNWKI